MAPEEAKRRIGATLAKARDWFNANADKIDETNGPSDQHLLELAGFAVEIVAVLKAVEA